MDLKKCFVISPIGSDGSDIRKRSDSIFKFVIKKAAAECGYEAERADHISDPGMITVQVIQRIVEAPLVIADLTGRNPNVYYELAIRHAIRKPLVQIIDRGESLPFDVADSRTVHIDHRDMESVENAKLSIIAQIKALDADPSKFETPISVAMDLQILRQSDDLEHRSLAEILSTITGVHRTVSRIEKRVKSLQMAGIDAGSVGADSDDLFAMLEASVTELKKSAHQKRLQNTNEKDPDAE